MTPHEIADMCHGIAAQQIDQLRDVLTVAFLLVFVCLGTVVYDVWLRLDRKQDR